MHANNHLEFVNPPPPLHPKQYFPTHMTVPDLPCQKSIFIYKKHYYVPFYFANEKIFYAEDRAKMNRELNLFVLWEIGFLAPQIGHGSTMRSRLS